MYRNWNRKTGIRYIAGLTGVYFIGFLVFFLILSGIKHRGFQTAQMESAEMLLLSLGLALVPAGSFSGFVTAFIHIDTMSTKKLVLIVIFCIPLVIAMVPFGLIMMIPNIAAIIKSKNT